MSTSICAVQDCDKKAITRNMCRLHYQRWRKHGDPTISLHGELLRFLHEEVLTYKGDDCLWWPYARSKGYGEIHINGVQRQVHVVVCEMVNGPRTSQNHVASHLCGNGYKGCVNPGHLKWQTRKEDQADRVTHGTASRGEQHGMSKLTDESIQAIRSLKGKMSQAEIAKRFGVDSSTISDIMRRKRWASLK